MESHDVEGLVEKTTVRNDVRDIQVFANAFSERSVDFETIRWTGSKTVDIRSSRDQVITAVKRALDAEDIEIPFPYRTLVFKDSNGIENEDRNSE